MVHKPLKKVHPLSQKYKVLLAMKKLCSSSGDIWIVGVPVESANLTYIIHVDTLYEWKLRGQNLQSENAWRLICE